MRGSLMSHGDYILTHILNLRQFSVKYFRQKNPQPASRVRLQVRAFTLEHHLYRHGDTINLLDTRDELARLKSERKPNSALGGESFRSVRSCNVDEKKWSKRETKNSCMGGRRLLCNTWYCKFQNCKQLNESNIQ